MSAKAARNAIWIAIATTIGGCFLPRILFQGTYSDTFPPIWKEALLFFVTGYIGAFSVFLLIYRIKEAWNQEKTPFRNAGKTDDIRGRTLFDSELPPDIDWGEVNDFLRATEFYKDLLLDYWRESEVFLSYPLSDTSMECLRCIHEDLLSCYRGAFAFDEDGRENRGEEYRLLREYLYSKYDRLDADLLKNIYLKYLQADR